MEDSKGDFTTSSSTLLMSLLSEPISCTWMPPEKENFGESPKLIPLVPGIVDKPPSGRKADTPKDLDPPELSLDLYTIPESQSEENSSRSELEYTFTSRTINSKPPQTKRESESLVSDLCLEDIDDDISDNINNVEKQTDLILKDLQDEQNQLNEIVSDIDKLFQKDESVKNDSGRSSVKSLSTSCLSVKSCETDNKLPSARKNDEKINSDLQNKVSDNGNDGPSYGDIVSILEELEKENSNDTVNKKIQRKSKSPIRKDVDRKDVKSAKDYSDILSYLDEIDQNCTNTLNVAKQRVQCITELASTNIRLDAIPKVDDLLQLTNIELANYVIDLTLRLEDKVSSVNILKSEILKLHKIIANNEEDREKYVKQKVQMEKNKYEPIIKRHQGFIDQLIIDKKELNEKCEHLMNEIKTLESRYSHNVHAMEQRHKIEIRRCREMHEAAEKVKREKWMEAKTAKIKEYTVKSVEHEINSMQSKYEKEISDLKLSHKHEIEELELKAARKTQQQCEILREQLTKEREHAIANEREALRQRFELLVESEEKGYQEQKRKLKEEHATKINELKNREIALEKEKEEAIDIVKHGCEERLKTAQRRHEIQITNMKESLRLEIEMWKTSYLKEQSAKMAEMESRVRENFKKERDREIEMVIDKLERESERTKKELEISTENKLRRLKEKYEEEIRNYKLAEEDYKYRQEMMRSDIEALENTNIKLKNNIKKLQEEHHSLKMISDSFHAEKNNLRNIIKQEFISEITNLKNQLNNEQNKKEKELQDIYNRVKVSIARKDEQINKINEDNKSLHEKCKLLEGVIEQQRRDYLIK